MGQFVVAKHFCNACDLKIILHIQILEATEFRGMNQILEQLSCRVFDSIGVLYPLYECGRTCL